MSVAKPIPINQTFSLPDQKPAFSRLSKRELEEVQTTSTQYPQKNDHAVDRQHSFDLRFQKSSNKRSSTTTIDSSDNIKKSTELVESGNDDPNENSDSLHHNLNELPRGTSLAGGMMSGLSNIRQPDTRDESVVSTIAGSTQFLSKNVDVIPSNGILNSISDSHDDRIDFEEQIDEVGFHDQKTDGSNLIPLEVREEIAASRNEGDDADFSGTQQDRIREKTDKIGEGEGDSINVIQSSLTHAAIAPTTGSSASSGPDSSEATAAALRVTHLLDELTAVVSRLRLESNDGKEMTIQLRRDVLPETNIHIVSTAKQMEVSFLTGSAASNLLLNTHLTTLQNHLNALCPGQVVNIQTELASSAKSSQSGTEQDRSHDDLASFNQGNRGNFSNDEDAV